jgi:fluoroquinolone transport system permease protein
VNSASPTRLAVLSRHDVRLQWRYGILLAYVVVTAFYAALLGWGLPHLPSWTLALIVFTDPAAISFFFLGALMMLERAEGVRNALSTTPLLPGEYLFAKGTTLTALAVAACGILSLFASPGGNLPLLLITVALTSVQYLGIGVPIALRFRTVSGYLVGSTAFLIPLIAPGLLALLDPTPVWLLLLPAAAQFKLMLVSTGAANAGAPELLLMLGVSTLAAVGAVWIALRSLRREFGAA